jgi:hypothetical protein
MKTSRTASGLLLAATIALLAAAPAAAEEALVPPENSAVNQYTETFPTAGGDKDAHDHDGGNRTPKKVLGHKNAKKLEEQGPAGKATAELAAETAPNSVDAPLEVEPEEAVTEVEESDESGAGAPSRGDGGGNPGTESRGTAPTANATPTRVIVAEPDGSSGFAEVLGRATGSSQPGGMGIFLPLLILGTIFWAIAYVARQRRPLS